MVISNFPFSCSFWSLKYQYYIRTDPLFKGRDAFIFTAAVSSDTPIRVLCALFSTLHAVRHVNPHQLLPCVFQCAFLVPSNVSAYPLFCPCVALRPVILFHTPHSSQ